MQELAAKVLKLEESLRRREVSEGAGALNIALEGVKEYVSGRPRDIDTDILYARLLKLDELAKKHGGPQVGAKVQFVLKRFLLHKGESYVAPLVLELLSTKEEAQLLSQEHKLLRNFNEQKKPADNNRSAREARFDLQLTTQPSNGAGGPYPWFPYPHTSRVTSPPSQGFYGQQQFGRGGMRGRGIRGKFRGGMTCFLCNGPGHIVSDCPHNPNSGK